MKSILLFSCLVLLTCSFDKLINPEASPEAQQLYQRLILNYDKFVLSGQTTFNY